MSIDPNKLQNKINILIDHLFLGKLKIGNIKMEKQKNYRPFLWYETNDLFLEAMQSKNLEVDTEKKFFFQKNKEEETISYKMIPPIIYNISSETTISEYKKKLQSNDSLCFLIILIQAGSASMGIWQDDDFLQHKVISTYMVRKKQGKNQLTHLNKKGKSRQGSRIRLNNTVRFFENINTKLIEWQEEIEFCDILFYSCTPRMWGEVFRSKIACPIEREDERWSKIPLDVKVPNFKELQQIVYKITNGAIIEYE